ncbi:MAG: class A beta-lactamase [Pyrinomonadaceae bacterium]|nr:class A beta-lactamase [Pyrinomonadaceae bacterium]
MRRTFTKKSLIVLFAALCISFASCERVEKLAAGFPTPPPEVTTPTKKLSDLPLKPDADLQKQLEAIAADAKGKVGVAVLGLETGESASINADQRFPMQSVYKLPIALTVLTAVDAEKFALDEQIGFSVEDMVGPAQRSPMRDRFRSGGSMTVAELIRFAVSESDGTASDVLLRIIGGPAEVQIFLSAIGIRDLAVVSTEKELGSDRQAQFANFATPNAAIELLRSLHEGNGISPDNRELLLKFLAETETGPKRLKGLLPPGTYVAHKTGTSQTENGVTAATNDIGIITFPNGKHAAVAVFVSDSRADEKTREAVIARTAKAVWDRWSK